jgi:hypothetical protein
MSQPNWPDLPEAWAKDQATRTKYRELVLAAQIDLVKAEAAAPPPKHESLADDESEKKLHESLSTLIGESIERSRDGAKFVETAAAAVGTVYTGILAFSFAADKTPLPGRALYAAIFLGIAIVGAAVYLAFIQHIRPIGRVDYRGVRSEDQWRRTEYLAAWTRAVVQSRAWALRTAVVALAFGVMFMPFAFLPAHLSETAFESTPTVMEPTAEPSWPPPPSLAADPAIVATLYKAQLDAFVAEKATTTSAPTESTGVSTNVVAFVLFLAALAILGVVAAWGPISTKLGIGGRSSHAGQTPTKTT